MKVSVRAARRRNWHRSPKKLKTLIKPYENEGFCARSAPKNKSQSPQKLEILIKPYEHKGFAHITENQWKPNENQGFRQSLAAPWIRTSLKTNENPMKTKDPVIINRS